MDTVADFYTIQYLRGPCLDQWFNILLSVSTASEPAAIPPTKHVDYVRHRLEPRQLCRRRHLLRRSHVHTADIAVHSDRVQGHASQHLSLRHRRRFETGVQLLARCSHHYQLLDRVRRVQARLRCHWSLYKCQGLFCYFCMLLQTTYNQHYVNVLAKASIHE